MMSDRFSLLYRFYDDATNTWVDLTPQVDSRQTVITQNLCTNNFTSAKDEAVFVMPETNLFEYDGVTPTPKKKLIDKLLGGGDILVQINAPGPVDVLWNSEDVLWNGEHVQWGGSVRYFTGYVDRSSIELRSFPLPPRLEIRLQDVSILRLDDKVEYHILLQNKKISEIVGTLLTYAGYSYGSLSLDVSDDETIEAFAIDKDDADSYRSYIDTLLFEAGGYVLDFDENGIANVVKLQWDGSAAALRTIDNPMNADGVSMKSAYLKEDGVKVKWSSLAWTEENFPVWISNIQQEVEDGAWKGEEIEQLHYWPKDGDVSPSFMEYMADLLDRPYMTRASRVQNQDIEIIMAKDFSPVITAYRGGRPFHDTNFERPIPTSPVDFTDPDTYNLSSNPTYYAKKAWHLLRVPQWSVVPDVRDGIDNPLLEGWYTKSGDVYTKSTDIAAIPGRTYYMGADYDAVTPDPDDIPYVMGWYEKNSGVYSLTTDDHVVTGKTYYEATGGEVQLVFFSIKGKVLYRNKVNTVDMEGSKHPKEYESTYIYNQAHAERFAQFWWHFLQTSRYMFSWSEPNRRNALNDVVAVGIKGNGSTQKALIAGKTSKWINDNVEIISYTAVGIDTYTPADLVPISVVPSSTKPQVQPITSAKTAAFSTTPSYTLAQWQEFVGVLSTWEITNPSEFSVGDVAVINGTISDMDGLPISLYLTVTAVDDDSTPYTLTGTGVKIEYVPIVEEWDFELGASSVVRNARLAPYSSVDPNSYTDIQLTSLQKGFGQLEYWSCTGTPSKTFFGGNPGTQTTTGSAPVLRVAKDETVSEITVTMHTLDNSQSISRKIKVIDETDYDHDFGLWEPSGGYQLPDHFTISGIDYNIMEGDFFVAKTDFTVSGDTYKEGTPYKYSGVSWHNAITATSVSDAGRLLLCLANVLGSSSVQPSTAALYGWFENLVAKNAILENLVAMFLQVGPGDGTAGSGFRFRALNDDGNGSPVFDVYYGNKKVFQIDVTSGDILFGGGMVYHASTDTIEANNAVFNGIKINNSNGGEANFGSAIFKQENMTSNVYTLASSRYNDQGKYFFDAVSSVYNSTPGSGNYSPYFPCTVNSSVSGASNAKYVRSYYFYNPNYFDQYSEYAVFFYDENYHQISSLNCIRYTANHSDVRPFSVGDSVNFLTGGNLMILFNIPLVTGTPTLSSGRVYRDSNNFLKIVP